MVLSGLTPKVAYFSMEIALARAIPTYSGGLGVLAGDMLRSAADLGVPVAAVTLLHRKGYLVQHLDAAGNQTETPAMWNPSDALTPMPQVITVPLEGREVCVRAWLYVVRGISGYEVPVYLLDTALPENSPWDQTLTDSLYGGDEHYRICQEVVLGIGGVRMLRALGFSEIDSYHMNEGHSALLALALIEQRLEERGADLPNEEDVQFMRSKCVFTTHTPVPAGHDQFPSDLVRRVLGERWYAILEGSYGCPIGKLNMTYLALQSSRFINGVAMQHGEVSRGMFPRYPINAITNGVHAFTWTAPPFKMLFDTYIPAWRHDNLYLRYAIGIPLEEIRATHAGCKKILLDELRESTGTRLEESVLTIGFARRASTYKRADLVFRNFDRLRWIANRVGPIQLVFAGKAHASDGGGKALIRRIYEAKEALKDFIKVVYVENYDMRWGKMICAGVDLWLNTPHRPHEASGTSGMKAALNGVPSLSVLDGWWMEGHIEGVTGWSIGHGGEVTEDDSAEVASLYDKLETVILPMFYGRPSAYAEVMRSSIALNGSFFNTQRMVSQYVSNAYRGQA